MALCNNHDFPQKKNGSHDILDKILNFHFKKTFKNFFYVKLLSRSWVPVFDEITFDA